MKRATRGRWTVEKGGRFVGSRMGMAVTPKANRCCRNGGY